MTGTLPLFQELDPPERPARATAQRRHDPHLSAAWRLSRSMWRFPEHSEEQTQAGLAICRHLQALLAQDDGSSR